VEACCQEYMPGRDMPLIAPRSTNRVQAPEGHRSIVLPVCNRGFLVCAENIKHALQVTHGALRH